MSRRSFLRSISAAGCLIAGVACGSDSPTGPSGRKQLEALSPLLTQAVVASTVNPVPTVRLVDAKGQPVRGAKIAFNMWMGSGHVADTAVLTDQSGIATPGEWVLGNGAGRNELVASGDSVAPVHFLAYAIADAPVLIVPLFTGEQVGLLNSSVTPPGVRVYDRFYNLVEGAKVTFAVSGGGALAPGNAVTNIFGQTSAVSWTLDASPGVSTVSARVEGSDSVAIFTARAVDSALVRWYTLESINGASPDQFYVLGATMALTSDGSYFEDVLWQYGNSLVSNHNSGAYSAQATTIFFHSITGGGEQGRIEGDRLMFDRPDPDWGDYVTWSYKLVSGQSVQVQTGSK
jgi:hypothetical protein